MSFQLDIDINIYIVTSIYVFYLIFWMDYSLCFFIYERGWDKCTIEIDSMEFIQNLKWTIIIKKEYKKYLVVNEWTNGSDAWLTHSWWMDNQQFMIYN